ncbi:hypothetical protein IFM89_011484 [Coptis chinensis]|uniref:Autophagy-related protein 11 C-terminal domain-containing protein n=1 Tax=Coptis chinensis TaxID=261450 RepID=A0A835I7A6_9MAGN|nr:hypothetical protein IFM89_011484 [Coptis chinensis]
MPPKHATASKAMMVNEGSTSQAVSKNEERRTRRSTSRMIEEVEEMQKKEVSLKDLLRRMNELEKQNQMLMAENKSIREEKEKRAEDARQLRKAFNKKVRETHFQEGDLVLKVVTQAGKRAGKLAASWDGPYIIHKVGINGAYYLKMAEGVILTKPQNVNKILFLAEMQVQVNKIQFLVEISSSGQKLLVICRSSSRYQVNKILFLAEMQVQVNKIQFLAEMSSSDQFDVGQQCEVN